jgi:alpha/beta hydrolase fold
MSVVTVLTRTGRRLPKRGRRRRSSSCRRRARAWAFTSRLVASGHVRRLRDRVRRYRRDHDLLPARGQRCAAVAPARVSRDPRMWHRVAPVLAETFTVVCADLRGYGASGKPTADYSKRTLATDAVLVMAALGFPSFGLVGHDRGARVAYRAALDHPAHVERSQSSTSSRRSMQLTAPTRGSRSGSGRGRSSRDRRRFRSACSRLRPTRSSTRRSRRGAPIARRSPTTCGRHTSRRFAIRRNSRDLRGVSRRGYHRSRARCRGPRREPADRVPDARPVERRRRAGRVVHGPLGIWLGRRCHRPRATGKAPLS